MSPRPTNPGKVAQRRKAATLLVGEVRRRVATTDRNRITCPRAKTWMTPCVARDGALTCADDGLCVGCGGDPRELLREERTR